MQQSVSFFSKLQEKLNNNNTLEENQFKETGSRQKASSTYFFFVRKAEKQAEKPVLGGVGGIRWLGGWDGREMWELETPRKF